MRLFFVKTLRFVQPFSGIYDLLAIRVIGLIIHLFLSQYVIYSEKVGLSNKYLTIPLYEGIR